MSRPVRWPLVAGGACVGLALVAHASPLLAWHLGLANALRREPAAHRLRSPTVSEFPSVPDGWEAWSVGALRFALPDGGRRERGCEDAAASCFIVIPADGARDRASLSVFPDGHEEPYDEMRDFRAPDERDLSLWRSARANWRTVGALRTFVLTSRSRLDSSRFESDGARGVFVHSVREGRSRWVVSAYDRAGDTARGLTVAGLSEDDFRALLGSLDLRARAAPGGSGPPAGGGAP
ncbi:MAG: hypothetical protein ACQGVK_12330 [Myxococcota bacterium]